MYRADPAEALRRIAARVRPGGVLAFQELDLDPIAGRSGRPGSPRRTAPPAPVRHDPSRLNGNPNKLRMPWPSANVLT
nr:hypothetical protein GCM10020063_019880 [Dactylosporangium thailandense]